MQSALLKNSEKINNLYRVKEKNLWNYKEVFSNDNSYHFDEGGGLSFIARKEKCRIYDEKSNSMSFADVDPNYLGFTLAYSSKKIRIFLDGKMEIYEDTM